MQGQVPRRADLVPALPADLQERRRFDANAPWKSGDKATSTLDPEFLTAERFLSLYHDFHIACSIQFSRAIQNRSSHMPRSTVTKK